MKSLSLSIQEDGSFLSSLPVWAYYVILIGIAVLMIIIFKRRLNK